MRLWWQWWEHGWRSSSRCGTSRAYRSTWLICCCVLVITGFRFPRRRLASSTCAGYSRNLGKLSGGTVPRSSTPHQKSSSSSSSAPSRLTSSGSSSSGRSSASSAKCTTRGLVPEPKVREDGVAEGPRGFHGDAADYLVLPLSGFCPADLCVSVLGLTPRV